MINVLLRRLTGRPERPAPSPVAGDRDPPAAVPPPASTPTAYTLDVATLQRLFFDWAFDLPASPATADASAAEAAFAHLRMVAQRFDVRRMPRLPALVPQLMAAMRREDADAAEIATLLSRDPTLAGDVMRVARSAHYARAQPPSGLRQAVQLIGNDGLRQVVLGTVMRPILRGDAGLPGHAMASRLWAQSESRAWLCARLAPGIADAAEAQLAGIVAGTGVAALSRMVHASVLTDAAADPLFPARFLALAGPVAVRAAGHWQLPASVLDALDASESGPLAQVLAAGDRLAMGYRLIECGRLAGDAAWPTGLATHDAPDRRAALFLAMSHEVEPLEPESVAA